MKKELWYRIFDTAAILAVVGFLIRLGADCYLMKTGLTAMPFYGFLLVRSAEFLLPGLLFFLAGRAAKRKFNGNRSDS